MYPTKKYLRFFYLLFLGVSFISATFSQNRNVSGQKGFSVAGDVFGQRVFIENRGQFDRFSQNGEKVLFGYEAGGERMYFTKKGIIYLLQKEFEVSERQRERAEHGKEMHLKQPERHWLTAGWVNASPQVDVKAEEQQSHYFTYGTRDLNSATFKKLTYQNIYPNIDLVITIPEDKPNGIKYSFVLRPGAREENIKILYSEELRKIKRSDEGDLIIKTPLFDIIEHAPKTFYDQGEQIGSTFILNEDTIGFKLQNNLDRSKTIVIDPWVSAITFTLTNSGFDVDYDIAGNLFVYGSLNQSKIAKYNPTGLLQWVFSGSVTALNWGTAGVSNFVVMRANGKCYTGQGVASNASIIRIDANGNYDNFVSAGVTSWNEVWDLAYHCSTGNIYGIGGSTASNQSAGILNQVTGAITPVAFFPNITTVGHDVACYAADDNGAFFWIYSSNFSPAMSNKIARINSAFTSSVWIVSSGYSTLNEYANKGNFVSGSSSNGINCLAVNLNYLYYYDGLNFAVYNKTTGAPIYSLAVISTTLARQFAGIAVDDCDNVYLGTNNSILMYNFNGSSLTSLGSIPLSGSYVYDIKLDKQTNLLYVSGSGFVGVYNAISSTTCCPAITSCAFNNNTPPFSINTSVNCATLGSATVTANNPTFGPYSYTWMPVNQTGSVATNLTPGNYTILVTGTGCPGTSSSNVALAPQNTLTASVAVGYSGCPVPNSGTASIVNLTGGSGNQFYAWASPAGVQTTSIATAISTGSIYTVTVTDALTACQFSQTFTLTPATSPTPALSASSATACVGLNVNLSALAIGGSPPFNFSWALPITGTSFTTSVSSQTAGPIVYTVYVTDQNNCQKTATTSVNYISGPTLSVPNVTVCPSATGTLTASGASFYLWNGSQGSNTFAAAPPVPTQYTITGVSSGCSSSVTASISPVAAPVPTITSNAPVCFGQSLSLSALGATAAIWTGPSGYNSSATNTVISAAQLTHNGSYQVTITAANSCTATASKSVTIYSLPVVSATGASVCSTQSVQLSSQAQATLFSWLGPQGFSSQLQNPALTSVNANSSGNYSVIVTNVNSCTNIAIANVTITTNPVVAPFANSPVCESSTLNLYAGSQGGINYSWSGPSGFFTNSVNPIINTVGVSASGIYTLTATVGPCVVSNTVAVIVHSLPTPTLTGNSPLCEGKKIILNGIAPASNTITSWIWSGPVTPTALGANAYVDSCQTGNTGVYGIYVIDSHSCQATATLLVNVLIKPNVSATGTTVCLMNSASLTAQGASTYTWYNNFGVAVGAYTTAIIASAQNSAPIVYKVVGASVNGCVNTATALLSTWPLPSPSLSVKPGTVACANSQFSLTGEGGLWYFWAGPNSFNGSGENVSFTAPGAGSSGIYTLTAGNIHDCVAQTTIKLSVFDLPRGTLSGDLQNCVPFCGAYLFKGNPGSAPVTGLNWQVAGKDFAGSTFSCCFNIPGQYTVSGSLLDTNGCASTMKQVIDAWPKPVADFSFSPQNPIESFDEVKFVSTGKGENISKWSWYFYSGSTNNTTYQSGKNASYLFNTAGIYPIALVIKTEEGCLDSVVKTITVDEDFALYVPNAFTPNDDGINDIFTAVVRGVKEYHLDVFNRWGEFLFSSDDPQKGWDGSFKGKGCENDVYVWKISVISKRGVTKSLNGSVTLYR